MSVLVLFVVGIIALLANAPLIALGCGAGCGLLLIADHLAWLASQTEDDNGSRRPR